MSQLKDENISLRWEGGGVPKANGGSLLSASMTSRLGWMIFKMAPKVF